ncbi:dTDP-glucose 4,6-dehydratase [Candidatus Uhrbacteria bacterium]|nr:dTDP-glucose 4,6-dehydratase [Candidatus Uhrbacteria bacterium]
MRFLITGGLGFIGSNMIHYLLKKYPDISICNLDKMTYAGNPANLSDIENDPRYSFVKGDIADAAIVEKTFAEFQPDVVIHFAAETHVDRSIADPDVFIRSNTIGTHELLKAAKAHNVTRFHHVSTDEVYGHIALDSDERWTEESPYGPRSPYSASKAASDHFVRAYYHTYGLPITISNCANNIGPYMYPEKLLPLAITNILEGKKVPMYPPGNQVREWLYVEDHCSAIDSIVSKGIPGETYFVGPDNPQLSNLEVIKKLLAIMERGEDMIEFVKDRPGHDQKYALDHSKITRELGWHPRYSLDESLERMVDWYTKNEAWWKPLKSGEYLEYYTQQYLTRE